MPPEPTKTRAISRDVHITNRLTLWLTFNQARERGGMVKKGEKASMVVFWKQYETTDKETGEPTKVPVLRYYNVFNAEQVDGIEIPDAVKFEPIDFHPIDAAEAIAKGYTGGPVVEHDGGQQAFYRPASDTVHLPERTRFASVEEYYSTLFHELSHSSGHSSRLDRKLDTEPKPFGSPDYGKEELVAEMSAAFLCGHAGIQPVVIGNQAAYIGGWLKQLKLDKKLVVSAAGQAQRAADWIRGERG
jgi:antirestriction protein ArdC